MKKILIVLLVSIFVAPLAIAADADIASGLWQGEGRASGGMTGSIALELKQSGQLVGGAYDASIVGKRFYYKVAGQLNGNTLTLKFENALPWSGITAEISADGKTMTGDGIGPKGSRFSFTLTRR